MIPQSSREDERCKGGICMKKKDLEKVYSIRGSSAGISPRG